MTDKPQYPPYIYLSTALSIAGTDLLELAGAINERHEADHYKLDLAEKTASKVLDAVKAYSAAIEAKRMAEKRGQRTDDRSRCPECGGSILLGCHCFDPSDRPVEHSGEAA